MMPELTPTPHSTAPAAAVFAPTSGVRSKRGMSQSATPNAAMLHQP